MLSRVVGIAGLILLAFFHSPAHAQTNPSELASLSLEDLLNINVGEDPAGGKAKRWYFNYAFRFLDVGHYRQGTTDVSFDDVLFSPGDVRTNSNYPVVPTFIEQRVHSFSIGYAIDDQFSVGLSVPLIKQQTAHISSVPDFDEFVIMTDGIGDIAVNGSFTLRSDKQSSWKANIGLSLPTGSVDEIGDTPRAGAGTLERLPYTMQLGSGTFDLLLSISYGETAGSIEYGGNASTTFRTGTNNNGYRLGNNYGVQVWGRYAWHYWLQPGLQISLRQTDSIRGRDESLLVPAAFVFPASITDPDNYGGTKVKAGFSLRSCISSACNKNLTVNVGVPIYQNLDGIQPQERVEVSLMASIRF